MDEHTRRTFAEEGNQESLKNNQFVGGAMLLILIVLIFALSYASYAGWV